jgi:4-diphosphocytidyl-2-C-methyl-D-erythritol kinase
MRPPELTVPSFAKINWTLEILGRRPDGYHELRTILQTISLADTLTFTLADEGIKLSCDAPGIPTDESNLVVRAALALREFAGTGRGARIDLIKRIPAAAGLGGGSGNAAITLLALRYLWGVEASAQELIEIGRGLGADVPFFLLGGTGIGVGRGDEVYPLADVIAEHILLVNAGIAMPTREVYRGLPVELTKPGGKAKMPFSLEAANRSISAPAAMPLLRNDLESVVYARHPLLGQIRDLLHEAGAGGVLMSGSGATIFALFDSEATRSVARRDCTAAGWWCAPVRALSRKDYRLALARITPF